MNITVFVAMHARCGCKQIALIRVHRIYIVFVLQTETSTSFVPHVHMIVNTGKYGFITKVYFNNLFIVDGFHLTALITDNIIYI